MGYDGSINIDAKINSSGFNRGVDKIMGSLKGLAAAVGIAFGIAAVVNFGKASVSAATELSNALLGLQSILEGQGRSFNQAQKFIDEYISDGLIPATNAITAYKNLASRGYTDPQIQDTLQALKDSAAFGRQASYSLGDAVMTATEGLKNENSILVDNAGVTKNVAKMWEDYAKSIGVSTNNLTKEQKIQAEYLGIIEETRFQVGDAAKLTGTYSGQVQQLGFNFNNLKVAVGNALIPIASAVLPGLNAIITALTRVANLFAQVTTALFGRQAAQQQSVANTASNIAASSNDAAKAQNKLADATKKAGKAADGALAGFDELNVLQQDTASAGAADASVPDVSSEVGAPGANTAGSEWGAGVTVSPAVQAAVDAFKRIIAPLQAINFSNLKKAFDGLFEAVKPLGQTLFSGLEWAYTNLFVPLATWTIEDALPAFLGVLSGALEVLNSVLEALKPLAQWLYDNFLRPLAQWTGGVIVSALNGLKDALLGISDWIKKNQGIVQDIAVVAGSFAAAWLLVNGAVAIWNAIGLIATGITTAFGAAVTFLTSPIGLVVLAVGALIAIVVLLATHWDEVKAAAAAAWDWIVSVWNVAAEWFNDNVVTPVKNFFSSLWLSIQTTAQNAWEWIKTTWSVAATWFNNTVLTPIKNFFAAMWMAIKNAAQNAWSGIMGIWKVVSEWFNTTVVQPTGQFFADLWAGISGAADTAWQAIKEVWIKVNKWFQDSVINPLENAFKKSINFLIGLVEGFANSFIDGINAVIGILNKISIDVPDWDIFGDMAGTTFGFSIAPAKHLAIPRLATGAVIPPRAEFAAILGDQRSGTNIEAPADLIRSIVADEVGKLNIQPQVNVIASGDNTGFIRWVKFEVEQENNRMGPAFATGGGR